MSTAYNGEFLGRNWENGTWDDVIWFVPNMPLIGSSQTCLGARLGWGSPPQSSILVPSPPPPEHPEWMSEWVGKMGLVGGLHWEKLSDLAQGKH